MPEPQSSKPSTMSRQNGSKVVGGKHGPKVPTTMPQGLVARVGVLAEQGLREVIAADVFWCGGKRCDFPAKIFESLGDASVSLKHKHCIATFI